MANFVRNIKNESQDCMHTMQYTDEQLCIIRAPLNENTIVVSAAGSGKSSSIIGRIQHLMYQDVPLESMCYITYSKKLADEFADRLKSMSIVNLYHAGTIDSLCWRLLKQSKKRFECEPAQIVHKMLDYILESSTALQDMSEVKYIFLDEAQDLDDTRYQILKAMCHGRTTLAVGDPRQTIYQHLYEANPALMMQLLENAQVRHLTYCFRLTPELVEFVNAAFDFPGMRPMTSTKPSSGTRPQLVVMHAKPSTYAICRQEIVDHLTQRVKSLLDGHTRPQDIMMLSPAAKGKSERLLNAIRTGLESVGVPVFFNHHEYDSGHQQGSIGKDGVYLGTVHSAKGAEAKHVFLLNFYNGSGAYLPRLADGKINQDYKNLLYVACTRAKSSLELLETCHYPGENERIPFAIHGHEHLDVLSLHTTALGRAKKPEHLPVTGVTQILQHLKGKQIDALQECVVEQADELPSEQFAFHTPRIFLDNNDASVYGRFIEVAIVRKLAEAASHGHCASQKSERMTELLDRLRRMPLYLTEKEFNSLCKGHGKSIPSEKFLYSGQHCASLQKFVNKQLSNAKLTKSTIGPVEQVKIKLQSKNVHVFNNSDLFYKKLHTYWKHFDVIVDPDRATEDVIETIWTMILLQCFHESFLGFYWLQKNEMSSHQLLPVGAKSWSDYLEAARRSLESACDGKVNAYQEMVTWVDDDPEMALSGAIDLLTDQDEVVDIKCNMNETAVASLANRTQVQAYRGMLGASHKSAFLFSALSLTCYEVLPHDDDKVLQSLSLFRK